MERIAKGIYIPMEIWQAEDLCWNEKILLMEIDSFTSKGLDCYFSNEYIAKLLSVNTDTASRLVNQLIRKGYVRMTRFDGRHRYLQSNIEYQCRLDTIAEADSTQMSKQTLQECKPNITNKSIKETNRESRFAKPSIEEVKRYCEERKNGIDAAVFIDFYESKGWKVGTTPMKDWRAAIRTWERRRVVPQAKGSKAQVVTDVNDFWI